MHCTNVQNRGWGVLCHALGHAEHKPSFFNSPSSFSIKLFKSAQLHMHRTAKNSIGVNFSIGYGDKGHRTLIVKDHATLSTVYKAENF